MNIDNFKKVTVAPQIVIYKDLFKQSNSLIECANSDNSIFGTWDQWFSQGYRKGIDGEYYPNILDTDSDEVIKEKKIIQNFIETVRFIRKDYFSDYNKENSIWPKFVYDWNKMLIEPEGYDIDIFKWSDSKISVTKFNMGEIMMPYHVDDWDREEDFAYLKNIVTINIYLNNDYEGGEICAYDLNTNKSYVYKPSAGDAVVMPSHSPFYHAVKYFKGADRYFIRTFFKYDYKGAGIHKDKEELFLDTKKYVDQDLQTLSVSAEEVRVI
jgi:hypothetical protein